MYILKKYGENVQLFTVLYNKLLHCMCRLSNYPVQYGITLYINILNCTILYYIIHHCITLYRTVLHYTLYYTVQHLVGHISTHYSLV